MSGRRVSCASRVLYMLLLLAVIAAGAYALYVTGVIAPKGVPLEDLRRVLLVAASPDDQGDMVGQIIVVADTTKNPVALEALSPALEVSIPGTTYSQLGDAYPFGGGRAVAEALARARGGAPLPYVVIGPDMLSALVASADGGLSVTMPTAMSVFDGERLFTFVPGPRTLNGAQLQAVLKGAPYLPPTEREMLDAELGRELAILLAGHRPGLAAEAARGTLATDLSVEALERLQERLATIER